MVTPDDSGPKYPWGNEPWPGTEHLIDESKHRKDPKEAKDEFWFNQSEFEAVLARLRSRYNEISSANVRKHLQDAGNIKPKDFGQWAAAASLYNSAAGAHNLLSGAFENFLKAFQAVIDRLETTRKNNTGVEIDNIDAVTFNNIETIDLGQNNNPNPTPPAGPPDQQSSPPAYNSYS